MPAELDALLEAAIKGVDATPAAGLAIATALNTIGYGTTARLRTYDDNAFDMAAPPRESIAKLRGELVNNGAADDAESRAVIGALVKLVAPAGHAAGSASTGTAAQLAGGTPSKPEDDDANTLECYRDAKVLQSLEVELDEMLVTTGQMRRDVLKYGYITKVSSVTRVARLGTNTGTRRRLGLSSADGTGTADAVLELPDQKPTATDDTSQLKTNTRDLVHALVAALSVEIKPEAYGGRESGWTTPAGRTSQIRVSLTRARAETWLWAMIQSRLLGAAYARMVDTEVGKFLKMCARTTHIGNEVLDVMDASDPRRFHADPEPSAEVAPREEVNLATRDATKGGGAANGADCSSWLTTGRCSREECPYGHLESRRGLAQGSGRNKRQRENNQSAPNYAHAYPPPWAWGGKGKGGGGGGGGGKGNRGGGGGDNKKKGGRGGGGRNGGDGGGNHDWWGWGY
jgi:uncharacterized membrane protein YgcG